MMQKESEVPRHPTRKANLPAKPPEHEDPLALARRLMFPLPEQTSVHFFSVGHQS